MSQMEQTKQNVKGATIHLEPLDNGQIRLIFALDGQIRDEEILTRAALRSRLPELGLRVMGYLGGGDSQISQGAVRLGKIMEILS